MTSSPLLVSLQFEYANKSFEENFETLSTLIKTTPKNSIILAPELSLSGYNYDNLEKNAIKTNHFLPKIRALSKDRTLSFTIVKKKDKHYFNTAKIWHNEQEIYSRAKTKLFRLGDEDKYFSKEDSSEIKIIEIDGIKIGVLICFELRFIELWQQARGADIILVPTFWAKKRKKHLQTLASALAIMNQCFVMVANSSDEDMASSASIINPFGDVTCDDTSMSIMQTFDDTLIKKIKRYINIG